jgi:hypothetical protein
VSCQRRLNLSKLDPVAANLDLIVAPSEELDHTVGPPPREVAGAVEPGSRRNAEGIRNKPLGGQHRTMEVTSGHAVAADVELTGHAGRDGLEVLIKDVDPRVGDGTSNPDRPSRFRTAAAVDRAPDGCFSWPVFVEEFGPWKRVAEPSHQVLRTRLARDDDRAQRPQPLGRRIRKDRRQQRGNAQQVRRVLHFDQVGKRERVDRSVRRREHQPPALTKGPEQARHRAVERE